ncbi:MAG: 3-dehydroquinate synthase [Actinomycetota bacterium]|nr:3-dehydroquinate synthase [Actinomycetota bacterium]
MAETVEAAAATPYPVVVGTGLNIAAEVSEALQPGTAVVLTDSNVGPRHAGSVTADLESGGWRVLEVIEVPAGESSKSLAVYEEAIHHLAASGLTRDGTLFALGGGVVGDLAGFVAATYMRGISFVALPTTLLAMVDSSVGGKVGVDLPEGKNLVGAFLRPRLVAADLARLDTLPDREISCGLAEVVKMGLLAGGSFFGNLRLIGDARTRNAEALRTLVLDCVRFKADVVTEDELEMGRRAILNYGHTIGHALEAVADYALPHGEAIAAGMAAAAHLSREKLGTNFVALHEDLLQSAGLPAKASADDPEKILAAMGSDKKRRSGDGSCDSPAHRFVLLEDIGRPVWGVPVTNEEARRAIEAIA